MEGAATPGWLEGYLLTGRYGLYAAAGAFALVSAAMTIQHSPWRREARTLSWRAPVAPRLPHGGWPARLRGRAMR